MAQDFSSLPSGVADGNSVRPYTVRIADEKIRHMHELIRLSPVAAPTYESLQTDRTWGMTHEWLVQAKTYWSEKFNWEEQQKWINSYPQFMATIEDDDGRTHDIHFMALFSKKEDAVPLIMYHGWPGSFLEFTDILEELKRKYTPKTLPYHVIVPSLIGYAFSAGPPTDKNWTMKDSVRLFNKLMHTLGFGAGYVAQGGDLGCWHSRIMAYHYPECKAIHCKISVVIINIHTDLS
jgi:microsomal epoxide hydrolase